MISALALGLAVSMAPIHAKPGANLVEERFKASLNEMVQKVHAVEESATKRRAMIDWTMRLENGLEQVLGRESLDAGDRAALAALRNRFHAYRDELGGQGGLTRIEDANLDGFASYMQQDMEQAPVGGGIYISAGTLVIILLLIILLT